MKKDSEEFEGFVTSCSRRRVIAYSNSSTIQAKLASQALRPAVGDTVSIKSEKGEYLVNSIKERRNCISRTYEGKQRILGVNIDHLFCITAPLPLFNTTFIDRVLATAHAEQIPTTLILNKTDLDLSETTPLIDIYKDLEFQVIETSMKSGEGLTPLLNLLESDDSLDTILFTGMSGVGKSSILNELIPSANRDVGEVSEKTGQGRQTTSQSRAYPMALGERNVFLIDLPGVQNFGITHLSLREVRLSFPEIVSRQQYCEFSDCAHMKEQNCAVTQALEKGEISDSRYKSYVTMVEEIKANNAY